MTQPRIALLQSDAKLIPTSSSVSQDHGVDEEFCHQTFHIERQLLIVICIVAASYYCLSDDCSGIWANAVSMFYCGCFTLKRCSKNRCRRSSCTCEGSRHNRNVVDKFSGVAIQKHWPPRWRSRSDTARLECGAGRTGAASHDEQRPCSRVQVSSGS